MAALRVLTEERAYPGRAVRSLIPFSALPTGSYGIIVAREPSKLTVAWRVDDERLRDEFQVPQELQFLEEVPGTGSGD